MRSRAQRILIAAVGAVGIASFAAGCASTPAAPSAPTTMRLAQSGGVSTLDPAQWFGGVSLTYMHAMYDTLVQYAPDSATIVPDLATSWTVSGGGTIYVFNLRKGVKFSNGDPLTAQAVQYNMQRVTSKAAAAPYAFAYSDIQGYGAWNAGTASSLAGVKVLGPYQIEFDLTAPSGEFLNALALMSGAIGDPKVEKRHGFSAYSDYAVGTGPYVLSRWVHGQQIVLTANARYWGPKPKIQTIQTTLGVSPAAQLRLFEKGQIDVMGTAGNQGLDAKSYAAVQQSKQLSKRYRVAPSDTVTFLGFQMQTYPFNQLSVRQAVNFALDRQSINAVLTSGRAPLDNQGLFAPGMPGYDQTAVYPYAYDTAKAASLLAADGISPQHPVAVELAFQSGAQSILQAAQAVQSQLQPLGIDVSLKPVSWSTFFTNAQNLAQTTYGMYILTWAPDFPTAQDPLDSLFGANGIANFSGFQSQAVQGLIAQADALPGTEETQRIALYANANQQLLAQAPAVFLVYGIHDALVQPWVHYRTPGDLGLGPVYPLEVSGLSLAAH